MQWREVEGDLWTQPAARSKNALWHEVPLPAVAVAVAVAVAQLPSRQPGRNAVFGERDNGFSGCSRCKVRLDARVAELLAKQFQNERGQMPGDDEGKLHAWTLHDLRRTVSTWLSEQGELSHVVEALLNHVSGVAKRGVAGTYNRAIYRDQKRAVLKRWAEHVAGLAGENVSNVAVLGRG